MEVTPITELSFIKKGILFSELSRITYFSGIKLEDECQHLGIQVPIEISEKDSNFLRRQNFRSSIAKSENIHNII